MDTLASTGSAIDGFFDSKKFLITRMSDGGTRQNEKLMNTLASTGSAIDGFFDSKKFLITRMNDSGTHQNEKFLVTKMRGG